MDRLEDAKIIMRLLNKRIEKKLKSFTMIYSIKKVETPRKRRKENANLERKEIVDEIVMKVNRKGMDPRIRLRF